MNMKKGLILAAVVFSICFIYVSMNAPFIFAAEQAEKIDESNAPDNSYLAKFHAIKVVDRLMEDNLNDIYMLNVIVTNFSDKNWKGDYDNVYAGYKTAMEHYYKRDIIQARVDLEKNREDITNLLKKVIEEYSKDTAKILDDCATKVLILHLDATTRSDPDKNESLRLNQMRLKIAYSQMDDGAKSAKEHYYKGSIYHLRIAKSYGIKILEDLANPDERKSIQDKYKNHKADNMNRIYGASEKQQTQPSK